MSKTSDRDWEGKLLEQLGLDDDGHAALPLHRETSPCLHRQTRLNMAARRVYCRACGEEVDPFTVLCRLASDGERYADLLRHLRDRTKAADERLKALLRLEANARARLKRIDPEAERKAPQRPWGHGTTPP